MYLRDKATATEESAGRNEPITPLEARQLSPFKAPEPLLIQMILSPKNGFPVVKGLMPVFELRAPLPIVPPKPRSLLPHPRWQRLRVVVDLPDGCLHGPPGGSGCISSVDCRSSID